MKLKHQGCQSESASGGCASAVRQASSASMNQLASSLLWLLAGGILGVFADVTLFRVTLPFYHAILDWLATFDNRAVTHYAFRLWIILPTFFVALLAGIISGRFVRDRLIFKLILFGIVKGSLLTYY